VGIRKYQTTRGLMLYVDSERPCLEDREKVPEAWLLVACYVEAVGPKGNAYVLKDRHGERGPIAKSTENDRLHRGRTATEPEGSR
jgi:hypothetical protein